MRNLVYGALIGAVTAANLPFDVEPASQDRYPMFREFQNRLKGIYKEPEPVSGIESIVECTTCTAAMVGASNWISQAKVRTSIIDWVIGACKTIKVVQPADTVCPGIVTLLGDVLLTVMADEILAEDRICNQLLGFCEKPKYTHVSVEEFSASILANKPSSIADDNYINNLYSEIKNDPSIRPTLKVVHMSDPHIDNEYAIGSNWMCGSAGLCCRKENGFPTDPYLQAKKWGGYQCDIPVRTLQSMLDHVKDEVKPDIMFWTGDNSPHDTWANTEEQVKNYTTQITDMIKKTFADSSIKVYPSLGNHDTWPVN